MIIIKKIFMAKNVFDLPPLVILDAGHGCDTPGKRSPVWADGRQLLEWELNRDLARRTQALLADSGADVRLLVPEDDDIPLRIRLQRATTLCNEHRARGGIFALRLLVSIHANASTNGSQQCKAPLATPCHDCNEPCDLRHTPRGWECFANGARASSQQLGELFLRRAMRLLPSDIPVRASHGDLRTHPEGHVKAEQFYMLKQPPCVTLLTENLFMDNYADCSLLLSAGGRELLAQLHAEAINEYLEIFR